MAKDDPGAVTPAAAVARHLEWLEFALEAARDEEIRRRGRLDKASDKNRSKRTVRLGEVTAEIRELAALVGGLRELQARAAAASTSAATSAAPRRTRGRPATKTASPRSRAAKPAAAKPAAAKPAAAKPAAAAPAAKPTRRPRTSGQTPPSS